MHWKEAIALHCEHERFLNARPNTINNHDHQLEAFGRFLTKIGMEDVTEVTPKVLEQYRTYLFEYRTTKGKPLAIKSQILRLSSINRLYETLVEKGIVLVNVALKIPLPRPPETVPKRLPTVREIERMLAKMPVATPMQFRDRSIIETFYATGIRQAELASLAITDFNAKHRELRIVGKGLKDRNLPLAGRCVDCLTEYIGKVRPLLPQGPYLFPTKSGAMLEPKSLLDMVARAAKKAGIKSPVKTHTFRHVLATELLRNGASLRGIQEYLGHSSVETTVLYVHVLGTDLKKAHQQFHPREREYGDGK